MTYKSEFLNILSERGFIHQCSDFEGLDKKLGEGVQSAYIGFDATAKSLHIGNLTGIMMLKWFQETGHKPITLMGGGTSKIGDPSFKDQSRNLMTDETIRENMENIRSNCFNQFLRYGDGPADAVMVNNDDWLSELKYLDFLRDYGRYFTVNRMIAFDSVKTRLERESPLTLLEFNYMVMQGYDFLAIHREYGTILQMGGSDQWGNIINGVDLAHKSDQAQLFALTAPLLLNSAGEKMGKTVNGAVWLNRNMLSPYDYWQYFRNVDDADVGNLLARFTMLPMDEVRRLAALQGSEINEAKKILAHEATKLCHGKQAAIEAEKTAKNVFERGSVGSELPSVIISEQRLRAGIPLTELLVEIKLCNSKSEAKRLIAGGGVRIDNKQITTENYLVTTQDMALDYDFGSDGNWIKISAGKKRHALVKTA
ncbi:MAG: tyrosine--tRNA ligase [Micavibrio sp.]